MGMTNEWDATGFGATMSATFAFGSDEEGRCYTFTSCEQAEKNLYPNLHQNNNACYLPQSPDFCCNEITKEE